jgi:mono/diheme cytochrome c family protein
MKLILPLTALGVALAGFAACAQTPPQKHWDIGTIDVTKLPPASDQQDVTFDKDILPLFKASCVRCHGPNRPHASFRLDSLAGVLAGGHDGKMVVPGDSRKSLLAVAAARIDPGTTMPPKPRPPGANSGGSASHETNSAARKPQPPPQPLTAEQAGLVRAWIDQGAK